MAGRLRQQRLGLSHPMGVLRPTMVLDREGTDGRFRRREQVAQRHPGPMVEAAITSCAAAGLPEAGYSIPYNAGSNPTKSWIVASWRTIPTVGIAVSQWGLITGTARGLIGGDWQLAAESEGTVTLLGVPCSEVR